MKKLFLSLAVISLLAGCITLPPPYIPTQLNENAKGVATTRGTPFNCKMLGEVEGKESWGHNGQRLGSPEQVIEGAMNDVRNKAADVVGSAKKRFVLYVIKDDADCGSHVCSKDVADSPVLVKYSVTAQVFECGDK